MAGTTANILVRAMAIASADVEVYGILVSLHYSFVSRIIVVHMHFFVKQGS